MIRNYRAIAFVVCGLVILGGVFLYRQTTTPLMSPTTLSTLHTRTISVGGTTLVVEVAATDIQRQQGLSGRLSLPKGKGMLFVFDEPGQYGFWMKDMHFPIDIVWINEGGVVVTIADNVSPDTYPHSFHSSAPAQYVLEVPAGFTQNQGIALGAKIVI